MYYSIKVMICRTVVLVCILCSMFASETWGRGKTSSLVQCLAKEEENIHRGKVAGPIVVLNRELFSHFTEAGQLLLKGEYFHRVCRSEGPFTPSLNLLKLILTHEEEAFVSSKASRPLAKETVRKAGRLLLDYLAGLQSLAPRADCLPDKMKPLREIHRKYRHIEQHVESNQLIAPEDVAQVFSQLPSLDELTQSCRDK